MKITGGMTRIVVLYRGKAIKVARVQPFQFCWRALKFVFKRKNIQSVKRTYDETPRQLALRVLSNGWLANQFEFEVSKQNVANALVAKTCMRYLGGLIIVQERGQPVSVAEARTHPFWCAMLREKRSFPQAEVAAAVQFSLHEGRVKIHDLGLPHLICPALNIHLKDTERK